MTLKKKVLFIDDEADIFSFLVKELRERGLDVCRVFKNGGEAAEYITNGGEYNAAIIDRELGGNNALGYFQGEELMELSKQHNPQAKIISFSGYLDKPGFADKALQKSSRNLIKELHDIVDYINLDII